jgi:acylphosphatase
MEGPARERRTVPAARLRLVAHGRVQGVNFRYHVVRAARRTGVTGWVANRWDGTVESVAEGDRAALVRFRRLFEQGSPSSAVTRVEENWAEPPTGEFEGFGVRYL